jgi:Peptidase family M41
VTEILRTTAYHEAGHAVIGLSLGVKVSRASIVPAEELGTVGHVQFIPEDTRRRGVLDKHFVLTVAGPIAEALYRGGFEAGRDPGAAFQKGYKSLSGYQQDLEVLRSGYAKEVKNRLIEIALKMVDFHWEHIRCIAGELERRNTLAEDDIVRVLTLEGLRLRRWPLRATRWKMNE